MEPLQEGLQFVLDLCQQIIFGSASAILLHIFRSDCNLTPARYKFHFGTIRLYYSEFHVKVFKADIWSRGQIEEGFVDLFIIDS